MSINLNTLPAEIIQGPIADHLKVRDLVELGHVNRRLRENIKEAFRSIGKVQAVKIDVQLKCVAQESSRYFVKTQTVQELERAVLDIEHEHWALWSLLSDRDRSDPPVLEFHENRLDERFKRDLTPILEKHFPLIDREDLYSYLKVQLLQVPRGARALLAQFRRIIGVLYENKAWELQSLASIFNKYVRGDENMSLLNIAKLSRLFPNLWVRDLKDVNVLCKQVTLIGKFVEDLFGTRTYLDSRVLGLIRRGYDQEVDAQLDARIYVHLFRSSIRYIDMGFGFNFLQRFQALRELRLDDGTLDHMPAAILKLRIKKLDIRGNRFTALPPIPITLEELYFAENPIDENSTENDDLHGRIKERILGEYIDYINPHQLDDGGKKEITDHLFNHALQVGRLKNGSTVRKSRVTIGGKEILVPLNRVMGAYLAACTHDIYQATGSEWFVPQDDEAGTSKTKKRE